LGSAVSGDSGSLPAPRLAATCLLACSLLTKSLASSLLASLAQGAGQKKSGTPVVSGWVSGQKGTRANVRRLQRAHFKLFLE
jgi:hypothetical protein